MLRFVASVLMTSGVLLIADAATTLAWQEPVSAFLSARAQDRLEDELDDAARRLSTAGLPPPGDPRRLRALAQRFGGLVGRGDPIGRLELPTLDRSYVMVEGTSTTNLRQGPGHLMDTALPGLGGTFAVAGHRTTYGAPFRSIDRLRRGDRIVASMPYGRFIYEVERQRIVAPNAVWVKRRVGYDRLILSACNPLYSAAQRLIVFGRLVRAEETLPAPAPR